jgi:hypothetical protein
MARQPITIGTANAKAGDTLFDAATKINANETELYTNVATNVSDIATNAQDIIDTAALITGFTKTYWFDANDTATATAPISHLANATDTYLTNNAVGSFTNSYNPDSKDALWNPVTNKFDFTSLKIGDTVEFRCDIEIDNAAAQEIDMLFSLAEGTGTAYELKISHTYYKTATTGKPLTFMFRIYMGDANTRTGGGRFRLSSAAATSIRVNGWFYQITEV